MFLLDDLLVKPLFTLLDILHSMALDEMYDTEAIRDEIKENRLLYEIGDRSKEEYERRQQELKAQLGTAERIQSQTRGRMEIKG